MIHLGNGSSARYEGKWHWTKDRVEFIGLVIPNNLIRKYVGPSDTEKQLSAIESWSFAPENHWGTLVLPVFPDSDVNFRKMSVR